MGKTIVAGNLAALWILAISLFIVYEIMMGKLKDATKKILADTVMALGFCIGFLTSVHYINMIPIQNDYAGYLLLVVYAAIGIIYCRAYLNVCRAAKRKLLMARVNKRRRWEKIFQDIDLGVANKTSD